jgi:hypothetical protein
LGSSYLLLQPALLIEYVKEPQVDFESFGFEYGMWDKRSFILQVFLCGLPLT